jgi:hypothetical protein
MQTIPIWRLGVNVCSGSPKTGQSSNDLAI